MKIGFIGGGKVGFSLGKYFVLNNLKVTGYYSRTYGSALEASEFTKTKAYNKLEELISDSDTIFITTSDDAIPILWQDIQRFNLKDKIICHTSGSLSSKIFSNINDSGAFGYSIHPIYPFSNKYTSYINLKNAYFSIEGCEKYKHKLKELIEGLGNKVIIRDSDKTALYHLASVTVSNLVLSLLNLGCTYLEGCGINSDDSLNALLPLIESNLENIKAKGFIESLTGPVERCDIETIKHHIEVIPKEHLSLYKTLSQNLIEIAKTKNPTRDYSKLEDLIGGTLYEK